MESGKDTREMQLVGVASFAHAVCHVAELAFAAVLPWVMVEFGLAADSAAALAVPGFVLFGVGAVPAGLWADRRGAGEAIRAYFAFVALAALVVASTRSPWQLGAGLTLLGAAISIYHPAGLALLSHGCTNRGRAMGIHGVAGSFGVALGPALGLFMAQRFSWRSAYVLVAALAATGLLATLLVRLQLTHEDSAAANVAKPVSTGSNNRVAVLAILFVAMTVGGFNYRCVTTALPTFLSGQEAAPEPTAAVQPANTPPGDLPSDPDDSASPSVAAAEGGLRVFLVFALGGIGQLWGGYLADRFRSAWSYALVILTTVPFALLLAHLDVGWPTIWAAGLAIFMFAQQPIENTIIAEATPAKWRSTVYGLKFILAFGVASGGVYVAGWVWQRYGLAHVFDVYVLGALVMAALAGLFAWRRG